MEKKIETTVVYLLRIRVSDFGSYGNIAVLVYLPKLESLWLGEGGDAAI